MDIVCEYTAIKPGEYYMLLCRDYNYYSFLKREKNLAINHFHVKLLNVLKMLVQ